MNFSDSLRENGHPDYRHVEESEFAQHVCRSLGWRVVETTVPVEAYDHEVSDRYSFTSTLYGLVNLRNQQVGLSQYTEASAWKSLDTLGYGLYHDLIHDLTGSPESTAQVSVTHDARGVVVMIDDNDKQYTVAYDSPQKAVRAMAEAWCAYRNIQFD